MKTIDGVARARIARGWLNSSLDQAAYAAAYGISERTLRAWMEKYGVGERPVARARAIIDNAVRQLVALRDALDADEACRVGMDDARQSGTAIATPNRRAEPAATPPSTPPAAAAREPSAARVKMERPAEAAVSLASAQPAAPAPGPVPKRRAGFFADLNTAP